MSAIEPEVRDLTVLDADIESELNPVEAEGFYRDTYECAGLALLQGEGKLLLAPPTPRPKKG
ncbi:hypothetical protein AB0A69_20240 [Streptomyces sp. NPDC045431]|uniref:hypothetical protein n=1 Tax=Streptomyces sp. NPDC045431 TaxID=3155613 RepID=UPI00340BB235